jgi:hypothetical protein
MWAAAAFQALVVQLEVGMVAVTARAPSVVAVVVPLMCARVEPQLRTG